MSDDADLLRRYAASGGEADFAEIVRRHIGLVYHTALRRIESDAHLAEDITQQVFVTLARNARSLANHPALAGWLFVATRHAVANVARRERRRQWSRHRRVCWPHLNSLCCAKRFRRPNSFRA